MISKSIEIKSIDFPSDAEIADIITATQIDGRYSDTSLKLFGAMYLNRGKILKLSFTSRSALMNTFRIMLKLTKHTKLKSVVMAKTYYEIYIDMRHLKKEE